MNARLSTTTARELFSMQMHARLLPGIASYLTIVLTFVVLLPLEALRLFHTGFYAGDLLFAVEINLVAAAVIAALAQVLFFSMRILAALLMRFEWIAVSLLPGVGVFLFFQAYVDSLATQHLPAVHPLIVWAATLTVGLLLSLPLLAVFPEIRGENSPLFLFSVLLSRGFMLFSDVSGFLSTPVEVFLQFLVFCFLYIWLQLRRRIHRSPHYSPFVVPALQELGVFVVWLILYAASGVFPFVLPSFDTTVLTMATGIGISWSLGARFLGSQLQGAGGGNAPWLAALSFILALGACVDLAIRYPVAAPSSSAHLLDSQTMAGRILLNAGVLLDEDNDGNSVWPGGDPDDRDPCIRGDGLNVCKGSPPLDLPPPLHNRILLVTAVSNEAEGRPLFIPGDSMTVVLKAMLRGVDGYSAEMRKPSDPLLALISEYGFRTICVSVHWKDLLPESGNGFDHGCQVVLEANDLKSAIDAAEKYSRKKFFVWIHLDRLEVGQTAVLKERISQYRYAIIRMNLAKQTAYAETKDCPIPLHLRSILPALAADTEAPGDPVDVRSNSSVRAPALYRLLGLHHARFFYSIKYSRKQDGTPYRRAFEGYTGAVWISEAGETID